MSDKHYTNNHWRGPDLDQIEAGFWRPFLSPNSSAGVTIVLALACLLMVVILLALALVIFSAISW